MIYQFEITYNGLSTVVDEPVGWSDVEFVKRRDENFYGVFFEFSSELKFHSEAYKILMNAFETDDVNANVTITIKQKKVSWKPFTNFFQGVILFDSIKFDNTFVTVTLEKISILREFKNIIEKPFPIVTNKSVLVHSQPLYYESQFDILDTLTGSSGGGSVIPELTLVNSELETTVNITGAIFYNGDTNTRSIRVHGHINCTTKLLPSNNDRGINMWVGYKPVGGGIPVYTLVYTNAPNPSSQNHSFDFDTTINVPFDNNILIKFDDDSFDGQFTTFDFTAGSFIKTTEVQTGDINTSINGVTIYEAFNQICTAYLGANTFQSTALQESEYLNNLITNGFNLRGKDEPITTTLKDLLNVVKTLFNFGLEVVDNKITISKYSDIYDTSSQQIIENTSLFETTISSNVFNQIGLSYDKYNLSDLPANGLYEFNTSRIYAINSTKISGKKELQAKFITAGTSIERLIRRKNQKTSSYQEDNDLVIISLNRVSVTTDIYTGVSDTYAIGTVSERNELLSITNVLEPSKTFNIRFSPRQIIKKHLQDYYFINEAEFAFITGEGNNEVEIETISENQNIGNNLTAYKSPMKIEFETDDIITSMYIQLNSQDYFINETKQKQNGKTSVIAIKSF